MFSLYNIQDQQKVTMAAAYLNDVGDAWFQGWSRVKEGYQWAKFLEDLCERFGDRNMMDIVEEFNKLRQEGTIQNYQLRFEELKLLMINFNPHLTEAHFVSSFISGLSEELRPMVKMLQPKMNKQAA